MTDIPSDGIDLTYRNVLIYPGEKNREKETAKGNETCDLAGIGKNIFRF